MMYWTRSGIGLGLVCTCLLLNGCAQTILTKPGFTQAEFERDKFQCDAQVVTMYGGYANKGIGHAIVARGDILRCMETKGYYVASEEESAAAREAEPTWRKPGATNEDLQRDKSACRPEDGSLRACLVAKGYRLLSKNEFEARANK